MSLVRTFVFARETKNTYRYDEKVVPGQVVMSGALYIHKNAMDKFEEITVTVEAK